MERPRRKGLDRISTEEQEEQAMTELLAQATTARALGPAMITGKRILQTEVGPGSLRLRFDDGSAVQVTGDFAVQYYPLHPELPGAQRADIEGEVLDEPDS